MKQQIFDTMTRAVTGLSRRRALHLLAGLGPGLTTAWLPDVAAAKKKRRKRKPKKPKPNAFGCLDVGDPCTTAEQCCSGICEGKKGKRQCRAHDTGSCNQKAPAYCEVNNPLDTICNGRDCACLRTTAGSVVCAQASDTLCANCQKDVDCITLGFPPGSACAPYAGELTCADTCETGVVCTWPCGFKPPDPAPD